MPAEGGVLILNGADITLAKLEIGIESASIQTRDKQRDAHLKSADFVNVEHFPVMSFQSTKIAKLDTTRCSSMGS